MSTPDTYETGTLTQMSKDPAQVQRRVSWTGLGMVETVLCCGGPLDGQVVEVWHDLVRHGLGFRHGYTGHPDDRPSLGYEYIHDGIDAESGMVRYRH